MASDLTFRHVGTDGAEHNLYRGFNHLTRRSQITARTHILIAWWDGEPQLYITDDLELGMSELARYYADEDWTDVVIQPFMMASDGPALIYLSKRLKADDSLDFRTAVRDVFIHSEGD
jgi:hypothetical protein